MFLVHQIVHQRPFLTLAIIQLKRKNQRGSEATCDAILVAAA